MNYTYAGIGSRQTPTNIQKLINKIAFGLYIEGFTCNSGGADGADLSFEMGAMDKKNIFLPWKDFNNSESDLYIQAMNPTLIVEAFSIAKEHHPAWDKLGPDAKKLMTRNSFQVLGPDLKSPVDFVVCWTKDGTAIGGTGQALRIAKKHQIPVFNLFKEHHRDYIIKKYISF